MSRWNDFTVIRAGRQKNLPPEIHFPDSLVSYANNVFYS